MQSIVISGLYTPVKFQENVGDSPAFLNFTLSVAGKGKFEGGAQDLRCKIYGKRAEELNAIEESAKGHPVVVTGRLIIVEQPKEKFYLVEANSVVQLSTTDAYDPEISVVNLAGRLGRDAEIRFFESGSSLAKLNLAVSRGKETDWHYPEVWNPTNYFADHALAGALVSVTGSFEWSEYKENVYWNIKCNSANILFKVPSEKRNGAKGKEDEPVAATSTPVPGDW